MSTLSIRKKAARITAVLLAGIMTGSTVFMDIAHAASIQSDGQLEAVQNGADLAEVYGADEAESTKYRVTDLTCENGTLTIVSTDTNAFAKGQIIEFTVEPDAGYYCAEVRAESASGEEIAVDGVTSTLDNGYMVAMPGEDLKIHAVCKKARMWNISDGISATSVTVKVSRTATEGSEVDFSIQTAPGTVPVNVTYSVTDAIPDTSAFTDGISAETGTEDSEGGLPESEITTFACDTLGDGNFRFVMPEGNVVLNAEFKNCEQHQITIADNNDSLHYPVTVTKSSAYLNDVVTVYGAPENSGYVTGMRLTTKDGIEVPFDMVEDSGSRVLQFFMPDEDVIITPVEAEDVKLQEGTESGREEVSLTLETGESGPVMSLRALRASIFSLARSSAYGVDHTTTGTDGNGTSAPKVTIKKNAYWTDIEQGLAEIELTETDTKVMAATPVDIAIAIDRSDSTLVDMSEIWYYRAGGEGWNFATNSYVTETSYQCGGYQSPCLNGDHFYVLWDGTQMYVTVIGSGNADTRQSYIWGINENTGAYERRNLWDSPVSYYVDDRKWDYSGDGNYALEECGAAIRQAPYELRAHHYDKNGNLISTNNAGNGMYTWALKSSWVTGTVNEQLTNHFGETVYQVTSIAADSSKYEKIYNYTTSNCSGYSRHRYEQYFASYIRSLLEALDDTTNTTGTPSRLAVWEFGSRDNYSAQIQVSDSDNKVYRLFNKEADQSMPGTISGHNFNGEGVVYYTGLQDVHTVSVGLNPIGGGGTDYAPSYGLAYALLTAREGTAYEKTPFKFIFLSDSEEESGYKNSTATTSINGKSMAYNASAIKNLLLAYDKSPVTVYTIGVGMGEVNGLTISDVSYLKGLSGRNAKSSAATSQMPTFFTTDVANKSNISNTLIQIAQDIVQNDGYILTAQNKVYTDTVSDYFDIQSVSTADGTITHEGATATWNVPAGADTTYTATIQIKLKDDYRYLISDTSYPTNQDNGTDYAAVMSYDIKDDAGNTRESGLSVKTQTPVLPYGTVELKSADDTGKIFPVRGTETESITVAVSRRVAGTENYGSTIATATAPFTAVSGNELGYSYEWLINRKDSDPSVPLVLYTNAEQQLEYRQLETAIPYYYQPVDPVVTQDGQTYTAQFTNEPYHADLTLPKKDLDNGNLIPDAGFSIFAYTGTGDVSDLQNYKIYCCKVLDTDNGQRAEISTVPYDTYVENPEMYDAVIMEYDEETGTYKNSAPLYYSLTNMGHFKVVETKTPSGYYGDWKDGYEPDENSTYLDKNSYDVVIGENEGSLQEFTIYNDQDEQIFTNKRIEYQIAIHKTGPVATGYTEDEDGNKETAYENLGLPGAWYVLRAADDIYDLQGNLLYHKGDIVTPEADRQTHYMALADLDLSEYKDRADGTHVVHVGYADYDGVEAEDTGNTETEGTYVKITDHMQDVNEGYVFNSLYDEFDLNVADGTLTFGDGQSTDHVFVTDEDGFAGIYALWHGSYEVIEIKAPAGYVRGKGFTVDLTGDGNSYERPTNSAFSAFSFVDNDYTKFVTADAGFYNERQVITTTPPDDPGKDVKDNHPSITITKHVEKEMYSPGETAYYHVTVTNNGDCALYDVTVTDCMDEEETVLLDTIDYLGVGESKTYDYEYVIPMDDVEGTLHHNIVRAEGHSLAEPAYGIPEKYVSDSDTAKIKVIDVIGVLKDSDKEVYHNGETVNYTVYVTNNGKLSYDYELTEEEREYLASEEYQESLREQGIYDDVAADYSQNIYKESVIPDDYQPTLSTVEITATGVSENDAAGNHTYSIKALLQEIKAKTLHNIVMTDTVSANAVLVDATVSENQIPGLSDVVYTSGSMNDRISHDDNGNVVINFLKPGETAVLKYELVIEDDFTGSTIDNHITAKADEGVSDEDDKRVSVVNPAIKVIKSAGQKDYDGNDILNGTGNLVHYDITVTNTGDCDLTDTMLYDVLLTDGVFMEDATVYDAEGNRVEPDVPETGESAEEAEEETAADEETVETVEAAETFSAETDAEEYETLTPEVNYTSNDVEMPVISAEHSREEFTGVAVDGEIVDSQYYEVSGDASVSVTFCMEYLNALSEGEHSVNLMFSDGYSNTILTVAVGNGNETTAEEDPYPDLYQCSVSGNSVNLGDLPVGWSKKITFAYTLKEEDAGKAVPNIMVAHALTAPDPENPDAPQLPVEDQDDEVVYSGLRIGVRKLSDIGGLTGPVENAKLGLYAAEDIKNIYDDVVYPEGTLIESVLTDTDGYARFTAEMLPLGEYVVRELEAPAGCYHSDGIIYLHGDDFMYNDVITTINVGGIIRDEAAKILVYLHDDHTMNELADAKLRVSSSNDTVSENSVDAWITTNTDGTGYEVYGCIPGQTYYLIEDQAREGYVNRIVRDLSDNELSTECVDTSVISFTVPETISETVTDETDPLYQKIKTDSEMGPYELHITNDFVHGELHVYKDGDYLDSWNFIDKAVHWFKSIFGFIKGSVSDVEFTITANADIYHPDGVTGILFHKGDVVWEGVKSIRKDAIEYTDNAGMATFTELYLGDYLLTETRGVEGLTAIDPVPFTLSYVDGQTPVVQATESVLNAYNPTQPVILNIHKEDKDTCWNLENAEFELYAAEDITKADGTVIAKADELLETGIFTDENGNATAESQLACGFTYYLKEVTAPDNYYVDKENEKIYIDTTPYNYTDDQIIINVNIQDDRSDDKITIDKSAPETVDVRDTIRFTIERISNDCRVPVDDFTMIDELPADKVDIQTLYTGSYTEDVPVKVYVRTTSWKDSDSSVSENSTGEADTSVSGNTITVSSAEDSNGWILWSDEVSSGKGTTLTKDTLKLKDGERIAQIKMEFGTVEPGFINSMEDKPYYEGPVDDIAADTEILNHISLTGTAFGKELKDEDDTKTTTTIPEEKIEVDKSAPETAKEGESIQYTIDVVKNGTSYDAEHFTLHDTLPDNVCMTSLYTGTYTDEVQLTVLYKTNLSTDWKVWKNGISATKAETLKSDSLKLGDREYITEFAIEYGTVPAGFSATKDVPNYYVTIGSSEVSKKYVNNIELSAYVNGNKLIDRDQTTTTIPDEPVKKVKTGDDNTLFVFFVCVFALALLSMVIYAAFTFIKRRHSVTVTDMGDHILVEPKRKVKNLPKESLKELIEKDR